MNERFASVFSNWVDSNYLRKKESMIKEYENTLSFELENQKKEFMKRCSNYDKKDVNLVDDELSKNLLNHFENEISKMEECFKNNEYFTPSPYIHSRMEPKNECINGKPEDYRDSLQYFLYLKYDIVFPIEIIEHMHGINPLEYALDDSTIYESYDNQIWFRFNFDKIDNPDFDCDSIKVSQSY